MALRSVFCMLSNSTSIGIIPSENFDGIIPTDVGVTQHAKYSSQCHRSTSHSSRSAKISAGNERFKPDHQSL